MSSAKTTPEQLLICEVCAEYEMASSSVMPVALEKHDVFISFRGEDTRNNFTSHLYEALLQKKIETYIDNMLNKGEEISPAIKKAIEESKLSVIIFSENYASSTWCLDELVHILKCKKNGQFVVPVFHNIHPTHVRKQSGSFADAFAVLEERFNERMDKVHEWRAALVTAANLSGWCSMDMSPESKLVKVIVEDVLKKLNRAPSSNDFRGLVGINKRIKKFEKLLDVGSRGVRIVGIWGIGGIGKTTLASVAFKQLASQFEGCCFLADIRGESKKHGIHHLRNTLFSELLETNLQTIECFGSSFVETRLNRKSVFIVLDDVSEPEQLELLVGDHNRFGSASRIIITTRDVQVLRDIEADEVYKVEELNEDEALQLFSLVAFKEKSSPTSYIKLSQKAINYAGGIPFALKVLGSFLRCKSKEKWGNAMDKLNKVPSNKIHNILKTSFDDLDDGEQSVFLDIACFFKGEDRDLVERILNLRDVEIDDLVDKSLVTVTHDNKLWMHDLIQEMGWEIVRKESIEEPGKRSRLWNAQDIYHVLKNNTGTGAVQGISLDMSNTRDINFNPVVFQKMYNLRFLKIYNSAEGNRESNVCPYEDLQYFSDKLTFLQWDGYCSRFLPPNFSPDNLVELIMPNSRVDRLWTGAQKLGNLKKIDLSYCYDLKKIPDLSHAPNLSTLSLEGCYSLDNFPELPRNVKSLNLSRTSIKEVPSSIDRISCLEMFDLSECSKLESLPTSICKLKSLQSLYLSASWNFKKFPEILEPMERLSELELDRTAIRELHPSIENLVGLQSLHLEMCQDLEFVPDSIYNISSLEYVSLWQCFKLKSSPEPPKIQSSQQTVSCSRTMVPKIKSSKTVLVQCWDDFSNVQNPSRRYNYIQRFPMETATSSSHSYSELTILEPQIPYTPPEDPVLADLVEKLMKSLADKEPAKEN